MKTIYRTIMMLATILLMVMLFPMTEVLADKAELIQDNNGEWYINMLGPGRHNRDEETVHIPEGIHIFKIYDDGGKNGNYTYKNSSTLYLYAPEGCHFRVEGTLTGEANGPSINEERKLGDWLQFFNKDRILCKNDGQPVPVTYTSSENYLKLTFQDQRDKTFSGLDLTVEVVYPEYHDITIQYTEGGYVLSDHATANVDEIVSLNVVPNEGYLLKNFYSYILYDDGYPRRLTTSNNANWGGIDRPITFVMPDSDVYIGAEFSPIEKSLDLELSTGNSTSYTINIPDGVREFELTQEFGPGKSPKAGTSARVVVTAPEGRTILATGVSGGYLTVWDANMHTYNYSGPGSTPQNISLSITGKNHVSWLAGFYSTSNVLTIDYKVPTDGLWGLDLHFTTDYPRELKKEIPENCKIVPNYYNEKTHFYTTNDSKGYCPGQSYQMYVAVQDEEYEISRVYLEYEGGIVDAELVPGSWYYDGNRLKYQLYKFTMPYGNPVFRVTTMLKADEIPEIRIDYDLNIFHNSGGSVTSEKDWYYAGDTVTFTVTPDEGYELRGDEETFYAKTASNNSPVALTKTGENTWQFTMPTDGVNIYAYFDQILQQEVIVHTNIWQVSIPQIQHGSVTASDNSPYNGDTVTLTASADPGYKLSSLSIRQQNGEEYIEAVEKEACVWSFVMPDDSVLVEAVFSDALSGALTGSGTEEAPYKIQTADQWQELSKYIQEGGRTDGLFFRLADDIQVTRMLGTDQTPFAGVFDGRNHTLEIQLEGSSGAEAAPTAPFRNIRDAKIMNLQTAGKVTGGVYSSGLVGSAGGNNLIHNCQVSVTLSDLSACAGFVGNSGSSHTTLSGCVFSGTVPDTDAAAIFIAGGGDASETVLSGCLDKSGLSSPIGRGEGTVSAENTWVINPDQIANATGSWIGKGAAYTAIDARGIVEAELTDSDSGFNRYGIFYAPAGEKMTINVRERSDGYPSALILVPEDEENIIRLLPEDDGIFTFSVPEENMTLFRAFRITFRNEDGTILQSEISVPGEMPVYAGETPRRPGDDHNLCAFLGWSPDIVPAVCDAEYFAEYSGKPTLEEGNNTFSIAGYETVRCSFTPQTDGDYRFWSTGDEVSLQICIWEDDQPLARSYSNGFDLYNFDCAVELKGGKKYTAEITSLYGSGEISVQVQKVNMHSITLLPYDTDQGLVICPNSAWEGQVLFIEPYPKEGYGVQRVVLTDGNGNVLSPGEDGAYIMPAYDITVSVQFALTNSIGFATDPHIRFEMVDIDGLIASAEDYPVAVPGIEIKAAFRCEEGYDYERVIVAGEDGSIIPSRVVFNENMHMPEIRFTMPDMFVMVQVLEQSSVCEVPAADFKLPDSLSEIGEEAFENGAMEVVYIPDGCISIGKGAFRNCENLTAVRVPEDCVIRQNAFEGCSNVTLYSVPGSPAEAWCLTHANCTFAPIAPLR